MLRRKSRPTAHQASPPGSARPGELRAKLRGAPNVPGSVRTAAGLSSQSLRCCWRSPHLVGRPLERNSGARAPRGVCMSAARVCRETDKRREHRIQGVAKKTLRARWPRGRLQLVSSEVAAREWANLLRPSRTFSLQEPAHLDLRGSGNQLTQGHVRINSEHAPKHRQGRWR